MHNYYTLHMLTIGFLYRQLQDLILVKQQAVDECKVLQQKAETSDQRIFELEERNVTLENELSKSYKTSLILQGIKLINI